MRPTARGLGLLAAGAALAFVATSMHSGTVGSLAALTLATPLVARGAGRGTQGSTWDPVGMPWPSGRCQMTPVAVTVAV